MRGFSSAGRAPALQAGGHRFESGNLHQVSRNRPKAQRSGFGPKRRSDGAGELSAEGGSEQCEVRDDEGP